MKLAKAFIYRACNIMELKTPLYLRKPQQYQLDTVVIASAAGVHEFQDSIFHLQGGGQPNDKGWVQVGDQKIEITGGVTERETGKLTYKLAGQANIPVGTEVTMLIDEELRQKHAKVHSAGHLIDLAVERLKYEWVVGKGYHFLDGPYVEYKGVAENQEKVAQDLNNELQNIIGEKIEANNQLYSYPEAVALKVIPEEFKVAYVRVIGFSTNSCPCGGTHIANSAELGSLVVTKVQKKKQNVRVYYKVDEIKKE